MLRQATHPVRISVELWIVGSAGICGGLLAILDCLASHRATFSLGADGPIWAGWAAGSFVGQSAVYGWTIGRREIALDGDYEPRARTLRRVGVQCLPCVLALAWFSVLLTGRDGSFAPILTAIGLATLATAGWITIWENRNRAWLLRLPGWFWPERYILADQTREHGFARYLTDAAGQEG